MAELTAERLEEAASIKQELLDGQVGWTPQKCDEERFYIAALRAHAAAIRECERQTPMLLLGDSEALGGQNNRIDAVNQERKRILSILRAKEQGNG